MFLDQIPALLMPNRCRRQFAIDADHAPAAQVDRLVAAQSPLLGTAMAGLPGLAVPTGLVGGLPVGVQRVSGCFRENRCLQAGGIIKHAAGFSALDHLVPRAG